MNPFLTVVFRCQSTDLDTSVFTSTIPRKDELVMWEDQEYRVTNVAYYFQGGVPITKTIATVNLRKVAA